MKDLLDNEVAVGDTIAYAIPKYSEIAVGKILSINAKSVTVKHGYKKTARYGNQFVLVKRLEWKNG